MALTKLALKALKNFGLYAVKNPSKALKVFKVATDLDSLNAHLNEKVQQNLDPNSTSHLFGKVSHGFNQLVYHGTDMLADTIDESLKLGPIGEEVEEYFTDNLRLIGSAAIVSDALLTKGAQNVIKFINPLQGIAEGVSNLNTKRVKRKQNRKFEKEMEKLTNEKRKNPVQEWIRS